MDENCIFVFQLLFLKKPNPPPPPFLASGWGWGWRCDPPDPPVKDLIVYYLYIIEVTKIRVSGIWGSLLAIIGYTRTFVINCLRWNH